MKKLIAAILSLVLVLSMSATAFATEGAANGNEAGDSQSIDVTAKTENAITTETHYSVDITWESMTFTYTEEGTKTWDPATHTYTTNSQGGWDKTEAKVTVTNHSNVEVNVTLEYTPVAGTGITGTLTNTTKTIAAGVEGKPNEADSLVATLTISGTPADSVTDAGIKIGSITVTIGQ